MSYRNYRYADPRTGIIHEEFSWEGNNGTSGPRVFIVVCPDKEGKKKKQVFYFKTQEAAKKFTDLVQKNNPDFSCSLSSFSKKGLPQFIEAIDSGQSKFSGIIDGDLWLSDSSKDPVYKFEIKAK